MVVGKTTGKKPTGDFCYSNLFNPVNSIYGASATGVPGVFSTGFRGRGILRLPPPRHRRPRRRPRRRPPPPQAARPRRPVRRDGACAARTGPPRCAGTGGGPLLPGRKRPRGPAPLPGRWRPASTLGAPGRVDRWEPRGAAVAAAPRRTPGGWSSPFPPGEAAAGPVVPAARTAVVRGGLGRAGVAGAKAGVGARLSFQAAAAGSRSSTNHTVREKTSP